MNANGVRKGGFCYEISLLKDLQGCCSRDDNDDKRVLFTVQQLTDKLISFDAVTKFPELVKTVSTNFEYSFSLSEIASLSQSYQRSKDNIEEIEIKTIPSRKYIGGVYAYIEILPEKEQERISKILQEQLEYESTGQAKKLEAS